MRKVLLINYYWPPCGGSAVQRWLDLTANFEREGIQSYVITVDEDVATFPFRDENLVNRIAPNTQVYKTNTSELFYLYDKFNKSKKSDSKDNTSPLHSKSGLINKIARFVRGNILLPDPRRGWNKHAYAKAKELLSEHHFDAIITAGPPQSSHLIGLRLKTEIPTIKWVADLHDYWTDIFILKDFYRTKIANFFDKRLEKKVLNTADKILVHCQFAKKLYQKRISNHRDKIHVLTMGYNGQLFPSQEPQKIKQKEFIITYTGILGEQYEPEVFFRSLKKLVDQNQNVPIKFRLAGAAYPLFFEQINNLQLNDHFEYLGYISQSESIKILKTSTILLLLNPNVPNNKLIVPGKIYEYLAAGKPILSISQSGSENEKIIDYCKGGKNFDWTDEQQIFEYLEQYLQIWLTHHTLDLDIQPQVYEFERSQEARKAIAFLDI